MEDFFKMFGQSGQGLAGLGSFATGIYGANRSKKLMDSQMDLQNKQFGMQKEAFDSNMQKEKFLRELDFTGGL